MTTDVKLCGGDGKVRYQSRQLARSKARSMGGHRSVYRCPHCREYHITSQNPNLRKAVDYLLDSLPPRLRRRA